MRRRGGRGEEEEEKKKARKKKEDIRKHWNINVVVSGTNRTLFFCAF